MQIHSNYTNSLLDFDVMEKEALSSGSPITVIKHDSLRDVIYNTLNITNSGKIEYKYINSSVEHAVVECTIDDGKGKVATEIGEAVPATLENDIARNYPVLIASQRAFDRAAILLLDLPGKQLSNDEVGIFIPADFVAGVDCQVSALEEVIEDSSENDESYVPAQIPEGVDAIIEDAPEEVFEAPNVNAERLEYLENYIPHVKNNTTLTIKAWYESDPNYIEKLAKVPNPAPVIKEAVENIREYLELIKEG